MKDLEERTQDALEFANEIQLDGTAEELEYKRKELERRFNLILKRA